MNLIKFLLLFLIAISFTFSQNQSGNKIDLMQNISKTKNVSASNDKIEFKNSAGSPIITITDEGARNGGSITLPPISSSTLLSPFNKLYNQEGILKFNGSTIGPDGGADSINQLADAKYDGLSLFLGEDAGLNDDGTDNANVGVGAYSLTSNTTGERNVAVGTSSLFYNTSGSGNTSIGVVSLNKNTTGFHNTAIGDGSLYSNATGVFNTASGYNALNFNTSGNNNTANGRFALRYNTIGDDNTSIGGSALARNTTGSKNVGIGYYANYGNQQGSNNTIIGYEAGRGTGLHDKSGNVFIGYQAGYDEMTDNKLYIENSNSSDPLIYGDFDTDDIKINGNLEVTNTTQIGVSGVPINEIKLLTGSLSTTSFVTNLSYPSGYNQTNSFLLSCKVGPPSGSGTIWENVGKFNNGNDRSLQVSFTENNIVIQRENSAINNLDYKMVLMKIE